MTMVGKALIGNAFAILAALGCLAAPVFADEAPPGSGEGRYSFNKVADGFLRLDDQTGEVALCSQRSVGWACQTAPEDRAVLESEIARLRAENAALKKDMLSRGLPLPSGAMPEPPALSQHDSVPQLHGDSDLDRMMAIVGRIWHRFVDAIARAEKQLQNKG
jgi:hypothetical protein